MAAVRFVGRGEPLLMASHPSRRPCVPVAGPIGWKACASALPAVARPGPSSSTAASHGRQSRQHQGWRSAASPRGAGLVCSATGDSLPYREVCKNRKARFDYEILETVETGIELKGTEVKCIRAGKISLQDAFCRVEGGQMILFNANIAKNDFANKYDNHEPARPRKLLMHKKEILKMGQKMAEKGLSVIPLKMYFRGSWLKVEIGLGRGKKNYDKRDSIKERDSKRELGRISKLQF